MGVIRDFLLDQSALRTHMLPELRAAVPASLSAAFGIDSYFQADIAAVVVEVRVSLGPGSADPHVHQMVGSDGVTVVDLVPLTARSLAVRHSIAERMLRRKRGASVLIAVREALTKMVRDAIDGCCKMCGCTGYAELCSCVAEPQGLGEPVDWLLFDAAEGSPWAAAAAAPAAGWAMQDIPENRYGWVSQRHNVRYGRWLDKGNAE